MSVLAHGIGAQHDLPLSPFYAFAGAFAALFVSFLALGLLWSASRFRGDRAGRPLPSALQRLADARPTRIALRALGLAAALYVTLNLLLGPDDPDRNPGPGAVYVLLWVGLVPASLLLGPVWRLLNPLRTVHLLGCRALGRDPAAGRPFPVRLGLWPAAAGLLAFTWLELVAPDPASATALLLFLSLHTAVHLAGAARHGAGWFDRADAFEVYSGLLARLSPLGRRPADRRLVLRSPFNGLDATPQPPDSSPPSASCSAPPPTTASPTPRPGSPPSRPHPWAAPPRPRSDSWAPSPSSPPCTPSAPAPSG